MFVKIGLLGISCEKKSDIESDKSFGHKNKNSIRDARTPQPGEIVFHTMKYRSSEKVQRSGYFHSSVSYIKLQIMFK